LIRESPETLQWFKNVSRCFEVFASDDNVSMPRKIRQLIADLEKHGFVNRGGKGSHRNFLHPSGVRITLSGAPGEDAKHYQERDLKRVIQKIQSWARRLIGM
jgi:predicted RNA binding protein YcfA (HicA-like mRNA interferase family)